MGKKWTYLPVRPIMSGDRSKPLWADINAVPSRKARMAIFHLGCRCQELESLVDLALERIEELEKAAKPS